MDDDEVARLADIVSERVFESMSRFVAALEELVRENELLRTKVAHLELLVFGPEGADEDDYGYDDSVDDDDDACEPGCGCVDNDDDGDLFDLN